MRPRTRTRIPNLAEPSTPSTSSSDTMPASKGSEGSQRAGVLTRIHSRNDVRAAAVDRDAAWHESDRALHKELVRAASSTDATLHVGGRGVAAPASGNESARGASGSSFALSCRYIYPKVAVWDKLTPVALRSPQQPPTVLVWTSSSRALCPW